MSFKPLLVTVTKAVKEIAPLVSTIYKLIESSPKNDSLQNLKVDKSFFTIADGCVQELLESYLFRGHKFAAIIGEEDNSNINITSRPYTIGTLAIPASLFDQIDKLKQSLEKMSRQIDNRAYKNVQIFIDPIDGTKEFVTGHGYACTICIGFAQHGRPVAGLVFRPVTEPVSYSVACAQESYFHSVKGEANSEDEGPQAFLSSRSVSPFLEALCQELGFKHVAVGGAGNKALMVIEGRGGCYIQDRGLSRWDTCAAEAVLEGCGGGFCRLHDIMKPTHEVSRYTYKKNSDGVNQDFVPNTSKVTLFNCSEEGKGVVGNLGSDVKQFKQFANLLGAFCVPQSSANDLSKFHDALSSAAQKHPPSFD